MTVKIAVDGREKRVKAIDGVPVMIREIYQNYSLPMKVDELSFEDLLFWYEPLIPSLVRMQKEAKKSSRRS